MTTAATGISSVACIDAAQNQPCSCHGENPREGVASLVWAAPMIQPINLQEEIMIRSYAVAASAVLVALTGPNARAADPLPTETHKVLTAALAVEAAQAAIAACNAQGYNVTVTVSDRTRMPKVIIVRDGPPGVGTEVTRRKAYTSALQRVSTGDFTKRVSTPGAFNPAVYDTQLTTGQGGVPIKVGEDTIGGIAVRRAAGGENGGTRGTPRLD